MVERNCGFANNCALAIIPGLVASCAVGLSLYASFWCQTVKFEANANQSDVTSASSLEYGLWSQKEAKVLKLFASDGQIQVVVSETCEKYGDGVEVNMEWMVAKAFSVIAPIIGGLVASLLIFAPLGTFPSPALWKLSGALLLCVAGFQGITFLIFESNICTMNYVPELLPNVYSDACEWHYGSTANAIACGLWFLSGLMVILIPTPERPQRERSRQQDVTYVEEGQEVDEKNQRYGVGEEDEADESSAVEYIDDTADNEMQ